MGQTEDNKVWCWMAWILGFGLTPSMRQWPKACQELTIDVKYSVTCIQTPLHAEGPQALGFCRSGSTRAS